MKSSTIYFSIIIPLYNKEQSISKTIESVLNQRYGNFELIIVNDGSTDHSFEIAKKHKDHRIKFIEQKNKGVSSARNKGIENAGFDWICFLDADDLFLPHYLETHVNLIDKYPNHQVFTTHYAQSKRYIKSINKDFVVKDYLLENVKSYAGTSQPICCVGTMVIHKDCFVNAGYFNIHATHGEDLEMWYRLSQKYEFVKSSVVAFYYNQMAENRATFKDGQQTIDSFPHKSAHSYYSLNLYKANFVFWDCIIQMKSKKNPLSNSKNANIFFIILYMFYVLFYRLRYRFQRDTQLFYTEIKEDGKFFFEK